MLFSELPFEIISKIAESILVNDMLQCSFTCRKLKAPFQQLFWKQSKVRSIKKLEDMFKIMNHSADESYSPSLIIQTLDLTRKCVLADILKSNTFRSLANLKHLAIQQISIDNVDIRDIQHGNPWRSLISLTLKVESPKRKLSAPLLTKILAAIPTLQQVDIGAYSSANTLSFNLKNFNLLHKRSPQLRYVKCQLQLMPIPTITAHEIPKTIPAAYVTTLDIDLFNWDYTWLYYFVCKYPNLRTLKWKTACESRESIFVDENTQMLSTIRKMDHVFPSLETIEFYTEDRTSWSHTIFWDILCRRNTPIKNIKYTIKHCNHWTRFIETVIARFMKYFSGSLETLIIDGYATDDLMRNKTLEFLPCPNLVDLEIKDSCVYIFVEDLLDNCTALKRFSFTNGDIYRNPLNDGNNRQHGLNILVLDNVATNVQVLDYISFACRNLEYMTLSNSRIGGPICEDTRRVLIDMSYTRFKTIELDRIQFYSSDRYINDDTVVSLLLISQPAIHPPSSEINQIVDKKYSEKHANWFHTFYKQDYSGKKSKIRSLLYKEVCNILKYYQDYKPKKANTISKSENRYCGHVKRENWKEDLDRGYVELKCGYLAKYKIPIN